MAERVLFMNYSFLAGSPAQWRLLLVVLRFDETTIPTPLDAAVGYLCKILGEQVIARP
jgi:hypothetical protein